MCTDLVNLLAWKGLWIPCPSGSWCVALATWPLGLWCNLTGDVAALCRHCGLDQVADTEAEWAASSASLRGGTELCPLASCLCWVLSPPHVCCVHHGMCNVYCKRCASSSMTTCGGEATRKASGVVGVPCLCGDHSCPVWSVRCTFRDFTERRQVHSANVCGDAGAVLSFLTRSPWPILGSSSPLLPRAAAGLRWQTRFRGGSPFKASLLEPEFLHPAVAPVVGWFLQWLPSLLASGGRVAQRHGGHSLSERKSCLVRAACPECRVRFGHFSLMFICCVMRAR